MGLFLGAIFFGCVLLLLSLFFRKDVEKSTGTGKNFEEPDTISNVGMSEGEIARTCILISCFCYSFFGMLFSGVLDFIWMEL